MEAKVNYLDEKLLINGYVFRRSNVRTGTAKIRAE